MQSQTKHNENCSNLNYVSVPSLARGVVLSVNDGVFTRRDLLYNQLYNIPESGEVIDSEHELLRRIRSHFHHLVNAIDVSSNSNHENLHPAVFQCACVRNGKLSLNIGLAISDKEYHLPRDDTATLAK